MLAARIVIVLVLSSAMAPLVFGDTKVDAQDGVVIFKVIPNRAGASIYFKNWNNITVRRVDQSESGKSYSIRYTDKGNTRTAVYSATLPAGRYKFVDFASYQCGWACVSSSIKINDRFNQFSVEAGKLTYLGNIIQLLASDSEAILVPQLDAPTTDAASIVTQIFPQYRAQFDSGVLGWADMPNEEANVSKYKKAKQLSAGLFSPAQMNDGSLVFGSSLGVVRHWNPGKAPDAWDTGASVSIETVLQLPDGTLLAGGELGVFRMSNDNGLTWSDVDAGIPFGVIKSLKASGSGDVYVTHLLGNAVSIYKGRLGQSPWKLVTEQTLTFSKMWDVSGVVPETFQYAHYLVTSLPGRNILVLDTRTDEFNVRKAAGGIQGITLTADGVIRCRCVGGIVVNPWESRDFGVTWQKSKVGRFMLLPSFKDEKVGVAMVGVWLSSDAYLAASNDGGQTWAKQISTSGKFYPSIFYADRQQSFVAYDNYDAILYSTDDGKSWISGY